MSFDVRLSPPSGPELTWEVVSEVLCLGTVCLVELLTVPPTALLSVAGCDDVVVVTVVVVDTPVVVVDTPVVVVDTPVVVVDTPVVVVDISVVVVDTSVVVARSAAATVNGIPTLYTMTTAPSDVDINLIDSVCINMVKVALC